jgi:hypothetical protein
VVSRKKSKRSYFVQSGLKEASLLRKHFSIRGQGDDVKLTGAFSPSKIKDFYREYFASVRPPNLGDDKILPKPERSKLRAWYIGQPDVNVLLNLVIRHCLYVEQIVVVDPFIDLPHDDVLNRPQVWAQTIINRALCLCALQDWIEQEIILVIPSLFYYYPELIQLISQMPYAFYPHQTDEQRREFERCLIIHLLVNEPPETRDALLDVIASMGRPFAEGERADLLDETEEYESKYPIRFRLSSDYYEKHFKGAETPSNIVDLTLSVPLLLAPVIAQQIGAFLIFERRLFYDMLSANQEPLNATSDSLQQLAVAFQELDFPFLHNVPLKQALELRKKGYLHSFRVYLRDLWSTVAEAEEDESLDAKILDFSDRLKSEHVTLEQEWNNIRNELRVKAATSGLIAGLSAASAIAVGNIDWKAGAIAGAAVLKEHIAGYTGSSAKLQETYRNPLSVFLMLKHQ